MTLASAPVLAADWPEMGLGSARARLSTEVLGPAFGRAASWASRLPPVKDQFYHALLASPAAADGFVVIGTSTNRLRALREADGALLWELPTEDVVLASPVLYRGRAYAASLRGDLSAVNLADGSLAWRTNVGGEVYAAPVIADGALFVAVGSPQPALVRVDLATGAVVWTTVVGPQPLRSAPAAADGHVVVGETDGTWHGVSAATGAVEWTTRIPGIVQMTGALIQQGTIYLAPAGSTLNVHALDLATGQPRQGWPLPVTLPDDPLAGTRVATNHVTSSLASAGANRLAFQVRREERVDTVGFGVVDNVTVTEFLVAVDVDSVSTAWVAQGTRVVAHDDNVVPTFGIGSTPAAFVSGNGILLAVTSALNAGFQIYSANGAVLSSGLLGGVTRGSPIVTNAGLIVGTDDGAITRLPSTANQPPLAPAAQFVPLAGALADVNNVRLEWGAALEPDGDAVSYIVRWDMDGEVLRDWAGEIETSAGQTTLRLPPLPTLPEGSAYTWAVRARDAKGALSPWSPLQSFQVVDPPPAVVGGQQFSDLSAALAAAIAGSIVTLGAGTYPLLDPLSVPPGVTVSGAGPHLTVISGQGLAAAVVINGGAPGQAALQSLTVANAAVGVRVDGGGGAELRNVILRDNSEAGLRVLANAAITLINGTVVRNAIGIDAAGEGAASVRNTLVTANAIGLATGGSARITTAYSDVAANTTADRRGLAIGHDDLAVAVNFVATNDWRLEAAQGTTDRGDPTDAFDQEPQPNGGRINIGAFGNTHFAEISASAGALTSPSDPGTPVAAPPVAGPDAGSSNGGGCTVAAGRLSSGLAHGLILAALALVIASRRRRPR
ncbi:MAG TPA: PQQ-binding-like beta-propeller repeat protein [Polyangia bacterium]|nr:PQQ-binding-like beta-propeller repeat protein [Polyangia bacterium]